MMSKYHIRMVGSSDGAWCSPGESRAPHTSNAHAAATSEQRERPTPTGNP